MAKKSTPKQTYWQGHRAYSEEGATALCPHPYKQTKAPSQHSRRQRWWDGYLDAQSDDHLGHILDKYGLGRMTDA